MEVITEHALVVSLLLSNKKLSVINLQYFSRIDSHRSYCSNNRRAELPVRH